MTRLQKIAVYLAGIVFLLSGIGKAMNVMLFQTLIHGYGFPYLDLLAPVIVWAELVLAFLLLVQERVKTVSLFCIGLLLLFTAVYTFGYTRQGITDCGCFGVIRLPDIAPVYVYIRNIVLLVLLNFIWLTAEDNKSTWTRRRWMVFGCYMGIALFLTGMTYRPKAYLPEKEHPLAGQLLANTPLADYVPNEGTACVLCYSYRCNHCMNTMENFFAMQRYGRVDTIVAVAVVPDNDEQLDSVRTAFRQFYPQIGGLEIGAATLPDITAFPTSLLVENDTIKQVMVGELPNPYFIETNKTKITH